jgi:hypothetical protein
MHPHQRRKPNQLVSVLDTLPPIQELRVSVSFDWDLDLLVDLQSPWNSSRFPNLKVIDVRRRFQEEIDTPPMILLTLQKYFAEAGITFRFVLSCSKPGRSVHPYIINNTKFCA